MVDIMLDIFIKNSNTQYWISWHLIVISAKLDCAENLIVLFFAFIHLQVDYLSRAESLLFWFRFHYLFSSLFFQYKIALSCLFIWLQDNFLLSFRNVHCWLLLYCNRKSSLLSFILTPGKPSILTQIYFFIDFFQLCKWNFSFNVFLSHTG